MSKVTFIRFPTPDIDYNRIKGPKGDKGEKGDKGDKGDNGSAVQNVNVGETRFSKSMLNNLTGESGEIAVEGESGITRSFRRIVSDERYGVFRNIQGARGGNVVYQPYNAYGAKAIVNSDVTIEPEKWNLLSLDTITGSAVDNLNIFTKRVITFEDRQLGTLGKNNMTSPYEFINQYRTKVTANVKLDLNIMRTQSLTIAIVPILQGTNTIDLSTCFRHYSGLELMVMNSIYNGTSLPTYKTEEYDLSASVFTPNRNYTIGIYFEGLENITVKQGTNIVVNLSGYDEDEE